jgi:hypothetical protein
MIDISNIPKEVVLAKLYNTACRHGDAVTHAKALTGLVDAHVGSISQVGYFPTPYVKVV